MFIESLFNRSASSFHGLCRLGLFSSKTEEITNEMSRAILSCACTLMVSPHAAGVLLVASLRG